MQVYVIRVSKRPKNNMKSKLLLATLSIVAFALFATASVSTLVAAVDQTVPYEVIELAGDSDDLKRNPSRIFMMSR